MEGGTMARYTVHRVLSLSTTALVVGILGHLNGGTVQADGATHANFPTASVFAVSPCNGEGVLLSGPLDVIFHANQHDAGAHANINSTFHGTGTGHQGNAYAVPAVSGTQIEAPSSRPRRGWRETMPREMRACTL